LTDEERIVLGLYDEEIDHLKAQAFTKLTNDELAALLEDEDES